jgi:hypothetical protein
MSFRKRNNNQQEPQKLEKIEEIIDEKPIIEEIKKDRVIDNLLITNLKKLNSNLLLKINDYDKIRKKLEKENRKVKIRNEKMKNDIVEFEKIKQEDIKKIELQHEQNKNDLNKEKNIEKQEIYIKHDKKILKINEQHEQYKKRYRKEIETINIQHEKYSDVIRKEEREKYDIKIKKKEETLQEMYNLKTKEEIEKIIKERKKRHKEIINTTQITQYIEKSIYEQLKQCRTNIIDGLKFDDPRFKIVCLCNYDKENTNEILIKNELNNIFSNIEYVPYFEFHSEYVSKILSVIKCLENFLNNTEKKYLIIFDYDFHWIFNKKIILEKLNSIKDYQFNLILLNYNNFFVKYKNNKKNNNNNLKNLIGIEKNANNINSFIINKIYAKKLIKILEDVVKKIVHNKNKNNKLYEIAFNKILKDKDCYGIVPSLGKQRLIYNTEQNANCIIAILDNKSEILFDEIPYMYKIFKKSTYNFSYNDTIFLNKEEDISSEIIKYCYKEFPKLDYLFVFKNGYKYDKQQIKLIFKKVIGTQSNLILNKNNEDFFIKLKKENLNLNNLINNKDFKIIDFEF